MKRTEARMCVAALDFRRFDVTRKLVAMSVAVSLRDLAEKSPSRTATSRPAASRECESVLLDDHRVLQITPRAGIPAAPIRPSRRRPLAPIASIAALAVAGACGPGPAPVTAPAPGAVPPAISAASLPPIPAVYGPLAPRVVYPPEGHVIESRDSSFVFGSLGTGRATLTINGTPARVYPNGAFMAWLPNPPAADPRYQLVAVVGADTARAVQQVRIGVPRLRPAVGGALVDSASITPRGNALALRRDEPVRVSVHAAPDAHAWLEGSNATTPLVQSPEAGAADSTFFAADVPAATLRAGATLFVARAADTARFPIARVAPADSAAPRWVMLGTIPSAPDTDRVVIARPTPGGTYKWFLLPGTVLEATGHAEGFTRVRLDESLETWVADADVTPLPAGTAPPRRVTANARVRSAPEWEDLVVPVGARPAYEVLEESDALTLVLYGTRGNTDIINYAANDSLVHDVQWSQDRDGRARYTVHLGAPLYGYLVLWEDGNLVLRIRRPPAVDGRHPLAGMTIVVDPGHPPIGATGPTGLWEPQATLAVGERLRAILESRGARVVMTRTTMDPVALGDRPVIARRADGNAFVSIHLNAYPDGVNVFTARNGSGTYFFHAQSVALARPVQRGLVAHLGLPDLGVNYDNLAVVRQTWMPSVLCEGAFVIVPEQEAALRTPEFQQRYAEGIADGLEGYFRSLRSAP